MPQSSMWREIPAGTVIGGKYEVLREIGKGGMSVVYLVMDTHLKVNWALKEVRRDGIKNYEVIRQGLVVETDMLKKLNHPHLPRIIDDIDTADSFLIVMDYIEGSSLQKLLKTEGAQSEERVVKWGKQLCDVLGYLHRQNPPIIYRDMKPEHVILQDNFVRLIDFGISVRKSEAAKAKPLGTKNWAAPEQLKGGELDERCDVYGVCRVGQPYCFIARLF